jgi:hypothetical protein
MLRVSLSLGEHAREPLQPLSSSILEKVMRNDWGGSGSVASASTVPCLD